MIEDGRNYNVYFNYTFLIFQKLLVEYSLLHFFLVFLILLSKYETNNELIIFWNHGIIKLI